LPSILVCIDARTNQPHERWLSNVAYDDPAQMTKPFTSLTIPTSIEYFSTIPMVISLLKNIKNDCFTPDHLCKISCNILRSFKPVPSISLSPIKPSALKVKEMVDPINFNHGSCLIPKDKLKLNPEAFLRYHVKYCMECKIDSKLSNSCYFNYLYNVLRYGWIPPLNSFELPKAKYKATNYRSNHKFFDVVNSLVYKYVDNKTISTFELDPFIEFNIINTPINVVIKKSESYRAALYSDVLLNSSHNIALVNEILENLSLDPVAPRPVFDFNCTGLNSILSTIRFSNSSIMDIIKFVTPESFMYIFDIEGYYTMFAFAEEFKTYSTFNFNNIWYVGDYILFGISSAPAFCATFTAEILFWIQEENIKASAMTDDFNLINSSLASVTVDAEFAIKMIEDVGLKIKTSKTKIGSSLTYLGVLIDAENMCISFDPIKSKSFLKTLENFIDILCKDPLQIRLSIVNSIAGKLNDYAKVILGGRLHIRYCWKLIYDCLIPKVVPSNHFITSLIYDMNWWIYKLQTWASSNLNGTEYPILNYHSLSASNKLIVIQSDASGPDGHGLIYGPLNSIDPHFFAKVWDSNFTPEYSHQFELVSIKDFFKEKKDSLGLNCLYIWLSDAASSVWSINKGYCSSQASFIVLSDIFESLEYLKSFIVGFWIPREENTIADYLSHYAKFCNVDKVEGYLSQISNLPVQKTSSSLSSSLSTSVIESVLNSNFYLPNNNLRIREGLNERQLHKSANRESTYNKGSENNGQEIRRILLQNGPSPISDIINLSTNVSFEFHGKKQWVYSITKLRDIKNQKSLCSRGSTLAINIRPPKVISMAKKDSVQRSYAFKSERCLDYETLIPNVEASINFNFGRCKDRCHSLVRSRRFTSPGRFDFRVESLRYNLVSEFRRLRFEGGPYKDSSKGRSNHNSFSKSYGSLCGKENEGIFQIG
jgi:hypothetical protein